MQNTELKAGGAKPVLLSGVPVSKNMVDTKGNGTNNSFHFLFHYSNITPIYNPIYYW